MTSSTLVRGIKVLKMIPTYQKITTPFSSLRIEGMRNIFWISVTHHQYSTPVRPNTLPGNDSQKRGDNANAKKVGPKITLLSHDNSITITTLEEAQKISKRRDLKLVKMIDLDTKTHRAIYKLMTGAEFFEEDKRQRQLKAANKESSSKGEKMVTLSHRIDEHDLQSRIKNIIKWLAKNYEARIVINGDAASMATAENVYRLIEEAMKDQGRIVQKRQKGNDIRFQIIPLKKDAKEVKDKEATG